MKLLLILASLAICSTVTKKTGSFASGLDGVWIPIRQELGGKPLPAAAFEKQKLTINDSMYTVVAESVDKGVIKFSDNKMDIYGREGVNAGKHFTAIYKLEGGLLTICYNLAGDSYPADFETKSKPTLFLSVFKNEEAK